MSIRPAGLLPLLLLVAACDGAEPTLDGDADTMASAAGEPGDRLFLAAARLGLPPAGITPEDLPAAGSPGAESFERFCTACHALPSPAMHTAGDWPVVARRMWLRTENMDPAFGVPVPDLGARLTILQYLIDHAFQVSGSDLPDLAGREEFERTCAQCHDLPDPRQHGPDDWFVVARRMDQHMQDVLDRGMTADTLERIVQFLREASTR